ncbi:MAG: hypothetical protein ACYDH9_15635 [Limisphaerales bacterium]
MIGMILVLAVPLVLTLLPIHQARLLVPVPPPPGTNPSPYGYTWSVSLFLVPDLVLGWWVLRMHRSSIEKRAFWVTVGLLVPLWSLLDVFLGLTFFNFKNLGASLFTFPGYTFDNGWQKAIPIEELGFYAFGFVAMLLVYIWGDEYWFKAYNRHEVPRESAEVRQLFGFHPTSAIVGVVLFAGALAYKKLGPHPFHQGIPGYFLFMLVATIIPSVFCFRFVRSAVNWRAFSLAFFYILFVSLLWEAALGIPYQWWGYNSGQMMGIFIGAFCNLPLEAVVLWVFASWTTIIIYETVHALVPLGWAGLMGALKANRTR